MQDIKVIIVDDSDADRYIVRRQLGKAGGFSNITERVTGEDFLSQLYTPPLPVQSENPPALVLMDINMPGLNGFETIEEMQQHIAAGEGPGDIIVMMYSSSNSRTDKSRAADLDMVKGYICKPLTQESIADIQQFYDEACAS